MSVRERALTQKLAATQARLSFGIWMWTRSNPGTSGLQEGTLQPRLPRFHRCLFAHF